MAGERTIHGRAVQCCARDAGSDGGQVRYHRPDRIGARFDRQGPSQCGRTLKGPGIGEILETADRRGIARAIRGRRSGRDVCRCGRRRSVDRIAELPLTSGSLGQPGGRGALGNHSLDRGNDAGVAGTPAQVAGHLPPDPVGVRMGQASHHIVGRCEHSRRAVAALECVMIAEGAPELSHQWIVGKALDGAHVRPVAGGSKGDAGAHGAAVHIHRAGTADPLLAAEVGAREVVVLTHEVGKMGPWFHSAVDAASVEGQAHRDRAFGVR